MSEGFREQLIEGYKEPRWERIRATIQANEALGENAAKLPYGIIRNLLYYKDAAKGYRLCIPSNLHKEVFSLAHDSMGHPGYTGTHEKLTESLYIHDLSKHLHDYIRHCPQCQSMQTLRTRS